MKKKVSKFFIVIIFLAGLSLLLYPFVANQWNNHRQKQLISSYEDNLTELTEAGDIDYAKELKKAQEEDSAYMNCLNLTGDGMMGIVEIPKIAIKLPIYHGTSDEVLQQAAGHLEGSSLPIGGESTHAVISAHRGLPSASLFTDLDQMKIGDHFLIHVLDNTLCYEVDQILVVEPEDTAALAVEEGEDLVTLLTCTPYGVNTQRLLVRGHRVDYVADEVAAEQTPLSGISLHTNYLLWVIVGILITGVFILILFIREKRFRKKAAREKEAEE